MKLLDVRVNLETERLVYILFQTVCNSHLNRYYTLPLFTSAARPFKNGLGVVVHPSVIFIALMHSLTMSNNPFMPRKARKIDYSDNPKTARNRQTEAAKQGFEAAELKAKNTHRVVKHRQLTKLHKSREWQSLSATDKTNREKEVMLALEERLRDKIKELEIEWERPNDDNKLLDM